MKHLSLLIFVISCLSTNLFAKDKIMILINPHAGGGKANSYYVSEVRSALAERYDLDEYFSPDPNIAQLAIQKASDSLLSYKGIVGIGGDGTIHEIYKALFNSQYSKEAIESIAIGHIPMGSGNALARSIHHHSCGEKVPYSPKALVDGIAVGESTALDLWSYENDQGRRGLFFLGVSHGIVSDIDIGSEWLRKPFGSLRFDVYGAYQWLLNPHYHGKLRIKTKGKDYTLDGPFRQIWSVNIPFASEKVCVAPNCHLDDGILHTMVVNAKDATWLALFSFLFKLDSGAHELPFVNMHEADELELTTGGGYRITVDGELLPLETKSLRIKALPFKGRVFTASCAENHSNLGRNQ